MLVSGFMVPAEKVVMCSEGDTILEAIEGVEAHNISAVVVVDEANNQPVGLVTKTELVEAYRRGTPLDAKVGSIMRKEFTKVLSNVDRDSAAKAFENTKSHHAVVVDKDGKFVGLISTWDIAAECARDSRAWPWTRTADGHVHPIHST